MTARELLYGFSSFIDALAAPPPAHAGHPFFVGPELRRISPGTAQRRRRLLQRRRGR